MEEQKTTAGQGLGVAGLVVGILAAILALIPCIGWIAIIPGVIALALSLVAFSQANKGNGSKGVIIGALVVSIIAISIGLIQIFLVATIASKGGHIINKIEKVAREFEGEYGKDFEEALEDVEKSLEKVSDDLEKTMEKLEEDMEEVSDRFEELSDEEKAGKIGKAAGRALKEFLEEMKDTTDIK